MKKTICVLCLLSAMAFLPTSGVLAASPASGVLAAEISAHCAVVYEPRTGTVLFERQAHEPMLIASTTKIMTALVVLERCALDEPVTVTAAHAATEGSSMYLQPGERYCVEDLLFGLLLVSGNDAAAALADHCAGSMAAFAALMNEKAAQLGLRNTHFVNAHGLDEADHYSSAYDLAVLMGAAMENPDFSRIIACHSYTCKEICYVNHNKLLETCPGCIGGKTGYTKAAGRVLVSCAEREGMRLICVTIQAPQDWTDHETLYAEAFDAYRYVPLPADAWRTLPVISGMAERVALQSDVPGLLVPKESALTVDVRLPRFVFAPVLYGAALGKVTVNVDGMRYEYALSAGQTVPTDPTAPLRAWEQFKRAWFTANRAEDFFINH